MIEPNRLAAPGERAALERVEALAGQIDALQVELFALSPSTLVEPAEHARLMAGVEAEADRCGRRALLDDACGRVRQALWTRLSQPVRYDALGRFPGTPVRADDAAALVTAVTDAVAVAVMEDRLALETAERLSAPGRALLGLPPIGDAGSPLPGDQRVRDDVPDGSAAPGGAVASAAARAGGPSAESRVPEPTAADWAEAASGSTRAGGYSPIAVGARVAVATMAATILAPVAVFIGVGLGMTGVGILAGLAVVAVFWLVATYRQ